MGSDASLLSIESRWDCLDTDSLFITGIEGIYLQILFDHMDVMHSQALNQRIEAAIQREVMQYGSPCTDCFKYRVTDVKTIRHV